ncbi:Hypothetical protein, putative [Bodo saltans]|uniref:Uncharacterized protein n=1 Tax=Bodo saltans TaxID=75058 RepID=A0A0S4ILQ2_BODSA|nr:Hypothetical protein, putative [Bodo saltans]|eukprot:CUF30155.1 Hypothetical protein, putative [Bodo saltans]
MASVAERSGMDLVHVSGLRPDERRLARHLEAVRTSWVAAPADDVPDVDTPRSEYDGYLPPPNENADYNDTNTDTSSTPRAALHSALILRRSRVSPRHSKAGRHWRHENEPISR